MSAKKSLLLVVQGAVTVALLMLLFRGFDWHSFAGVYARLPLSAYVVSFAVVLAGQLLYAWRWCVVLRTGGLPVSYRVVVQQSLIGMFVGNFLPSAVGGDVAKVYLLGRTHGYGAISASVILDRLLGFGILAVLAAVALVIDSPDAPVLRLARTAMLAVVAVTFVAVGFTLAGTGGMSRRLARFGPRVTRWTDALQRLRLGMLGGLKHPKVLWHATVAVLLYFALLTMVYRALIETLGGVRPGLLETLVVVASVSVMSNVPISINGLGLREQLHAALFAPLGVPKEVAVAISLLLFAHALVISMAGGFLWFRTDHPGASIVVPLA